MPKKPHEKSPEQMNPRRKRILYQCNHCGMKENDVLLGGFATAMVESLSDDEIGQLEGLITVPDNDLFNWILGKAPPEKEFDTDILRRIQDFNKKI